MLGGIGFKELLVIALIALLVFGSKRISSLGKDLGESIRGLRGGFKDVEEARQELNQIGRDR